MELGEEDDGGAGAEEGGSVGVDVCWTEEGVEVVGAVIRWQWP